RSVPYLIQGDNSVWMLNPLSGQSSRLATLNQQPQRLIFGGPKQNLFVLSSGSLVSLDWHGRQVGSLALKAPLDAIAFDDSHGRLAGFSLATQQLSFYDTSLRSLGSVSLPTLAGSGRVSLSFNPKDGTAWLHRDG